MDALRRLTFALLLVLGIVPAFGQAPPAIPALPDTERRTAYSISASTCICNVNFAIFGDGSDIDAWISVWVGGTRVLSTDPTFGWSLSSITGPISTIPRPITNAVLTFNTAQTGTIQIVGARRPRQLSQFQENRGVAARDLNQRLTDITAIERELWDKTNDLTGRGLFFAPGNTTGPMPSPAACAGAILGFDVSGLNPVCLQAVSLSAGTILTPSTTVVGDMVTWGGTNGKTLLDAGGPPRVQARGNISYYVNGNSGSTATCGAAGASTCVAGNDANNCLTPATACLTLQHVFNLTNSVDFGPLYTGFVYLAHNTGTTNYDLTCTAGPFIGTSTLTILGDSTNATGSLTVITDPAGNYGLFVKDGCTVTYQYVSFVDAPTNNAAGHVLAGVGNYGHVDLGNVTLGSLTIGNMVSAAYSSSISMIGPIAVTGGANSAFDVSGGGVMDFAAQTVTVSGTPAFATAFAVLTNGGVMNVNGSNFSGAATGLKCFISGSLELAGFDPNVVFPGSTNCTANNLVQSVNVTTGVLANGGTAFTLTATQPSSPVAGQNAVVWNITSAGSAAQNNGGFLFNYLAGYTGANRSASLNAVNSAAGTASTLIPAAGNNTIQSNAAGVYTSNATTTGLNVGSTGVASGGNINAGVVGAAQIAKNSAVNIGGAFSAINTGSSPVQVGLWASLNQTTPPAVSAAAIFDNAAQANPIALFQAAGSTVASVGPTGVTTAPAFTNSGTVFASLPTPVAGMTAYITDGKASNCADTSCTTFGTAVTGGAGVLPLLIWYTGAAWHLVGK